MKINRLNIAWLVLTVIVSIPNFANADSETIFKAMSDELNRSMEELQYEDYHKPFFISYELTDFKVIKSEASLGAIINSSEKKARNSNVRLMVGDYDVNDENWNDNTNKVHHNDGYRPLPLTDDYLALRRSFWMNTNNLYKTSAEKFKNKITAMEQKEMIVDDLPAPDFSKTESVVILKEPFCDEVTVEESKHWVKRVSDVFRSHPDIIESNVKYEYLNQLRYFISSEGTKMQIPSQFHVIQVSATIYSKENFKITDNLYYYAKCEADLPSLEEIEDDARLLVQNLKEKSSADLFDESYLGPVLFTGEAVTDMHFNKIFKKGEGLLARRRALVKSKNDVFIAKNKSWDDKMGNRVLDSKFTIYSKPFLSSFDNVALLGTYEVDREGVKPQDSLLLIDNGKLIHQLNDRRPTANQLFSNGHSRSYVKSGKINSKIGPDVIFVHANEGKSDVEMMNELKKLADDEGLDYVFLVQPLSGHANRGPINYYKLDVETGEKTLVRSVNYQTTGNELRDVFAVSESFQVVNTLIPDYVEQEQQMKRYANYPPEILALLNVSKNNYNEGTPASLICPESILLKQVELNGISKSINAEQAVVPRP